MIDNNNAPQTFTDAERELLSLWILEDNLARANELAASVKVSDTIYARHVKRVIDLVLSGAALTMTCPINLAMAVVTFFDVGHPIIFRQKRIGKGCQEFEIVKFRNMTNATDENGTLLPPDKRVTKWGRFVRRTSLDELLNFWSVFKGDMSLIGPRPLLPKYLPRYTERHKMRHAVRPGLECPNIAEIEKGESRWQRQLENDVWYVENVSFLVDLRMLAGLIKLTFSRDETASRAGASHGSFMGYDENGKVIDSFCIPEKYIERLRAEEDAIRKSMYNDTLGETEDD